jgi:Ni/Co efflux regulator RcnB
MKILVSALIAIALVSGSMVRAERTSGNSGQRKTEKHRHGKGFRKKGGEQERPRNATGTSKGLNPQPLPPGIYSRRRRHRRRH